MSFLKRLLFGLAVLSGVVAASSLVASTYFKRDVRAEVEQLFGSTDNEHEIIKPEDIEMLPDRIQQWLTYSGVVGKEKIVSVRLKQEAEMRLQADSQWMPVVAEQYFTIEEPGFIWNAKIKAAPLINIMGRDKYMNGKGNMLIKPLSLITIADSKGEEIDQGTLLRYLAETMWFPSAALSEYIQWDEVDENKMKATMTYGDVTASGIFTINENGEVTHFQAERYGDFEGEYSLETWSIPVHDYKAFEGIKVPTKGEITWKLDDGDFNWFNFKIQEIEYNKPSVY